MNESAGYITGYKAGLLEQTSVIEDHICVLERSRAVLTEVVRPIERNIEPGSTEAIILIHYLPHLTLLLQVADGLLWSSLQGLNAAVDRAHEEVKKNAG